MTENTFRTRLEAEKTELDVKIESLEIFMKSEDFRLGMSTEQRDQLVIQLAIMESYSAILKIRLKK